MILCLTPNPAIDRTMYVDSLILGEVHRAEKTLVAAGGKGLNVARTILALGGDPLCMGFVGGYMGNLLVELAEREGLSAHWTRIKNETRTCFILVKRGRDATVVNERGAEVDADECQTFLRDVWMQRSSQLICVSGSLPPGFSLNDFYTMLQGLVARGKSVWVDTSGVALNTTLDVHGLNIKVNVKELEETLRLKISNMEQAANAGRQLLGRGISSIAVTLGKDGAVLVVDSGVWFARPPEIEVVSSVGSGDAFLGGLVFALEQGHPPEVALRYGVAAGAANALHFEGAMVKREEFEVLWDKTVLTRIQL